MEQSISVSQMIQYFFLKDYAIWLAIAVVALAFTLYIYFANPKTLDYFQDYDGNQKITHIK